METIICINLYLVYTAVLLQNILDDPEVEEHYIPLKELFARSTMLDRAIYENLKQFCLHQQTPFDLINLKNAISKKNSYNTKILASIEQLALMITTHLSMQKETISKKQCLTRVKKIARVLKPTKKRPFDDIHMEISSLLTSLVQHLEESLKVLNDNSPLPPVSYSLYQILLGYGQYYVDSVPMREPGEDFFRFYKLYEQLTQSTLTPAFFKSKEENIVIEPEAFPAEIHMKLFSALNIPWPIFKRRYIMNSLGSRFVAEPLLLPLFAHEFGHLLDKKVTKIEDRVIQEAYMLFPMLFHQSQYDFTMWIKEIIADACAVVMMGPSYFLPLLVYMREEDKINASIYHPGFGFRSKIVYNYLKQNDYFSLFEPYYRRKIEEDVLFYQSNASASSEIAQQIEDIIENFSGYIYQSVIAFVKSNGIFLPAEAIIKFVCAQDGNIEKSLQVLEAKELSFKEFVLQQNLKHLLQAKTPF
jgi:hypothetical protein